MTQNLLKAKVQGETCKVGSGNKIIKYQIDAIVVRKVT